MDPEHDTKRLDELLAGGSTLMVGTGLPDISSKPLTVAEVDEDQLFILVDTQERWTASFRDGDPIHATLSDNRSNSWAELDGTGRLERDPELLDRLWTPAASAYFDDGRGTPTLAALVITVDEGRYWASASGRIGELFSVVGAALGRADAAGEQGDVDLTDR